MSSLMEAFHWAVDHRKPQVPLTWGSGSGGTAPRPCRIVRKYPSRLDISLGQRHPPPELTRWNKCSVDISWREEWSFGARLGAGGVASRSASVISLGITFKVTCRKHSSKGTAMN